MRMKKVILVLCLCLLCLVCSAVADNKDFKSEAYSGHLNNTNSFTIQSCTETCALWGKYCPSGGYEAFDYYAVSDHTWINQTNSPINKEFADAYSTHTATDTFVIAELGTTNPPVYYEEFSPCVDTFHAGGGLWYPGKWWTYAGTYPVASKFNVTVNVKEASILNPKISTAYVGLSNIGGVAFGFSDANGNITFNNLTSSSVYTISVQKSGYTDYLQNYTIPAYDSIVYVNLQSTSASPLGMWYNIKTSDTKQDVTYLTNMAEYYNGTWHNETTPHYTAEQIIGGMGDSYWIFKEIDGFMNNQPSLQNYLYNGDDVNSKIILTYSGYLPYTINHFTVNSFNYVILTPNSAMPPNGQCSYSFNVIDNTAEPIKILVNRFETGFSEILDISQKYVLSTNKNNGNYTFAAYNPTTGAQYNKGAFLCESGTNTTGNTVNGVHRESIYDALTYNNTPPKPLVLPKYNWVNLYDAQTGARIYPYDVSFEDSTGKFYNFTVSTDLGQNTPSGYISDGETVYLRVTKQYYKIPDQIIKLSDLPINMWGGHIISAYANRVNVDSGNYTIWTISVKDGVNLNPISNVDLTIYNGMNVWAKGNTNNAGVMVINLTHPTGIVYDVVGHKDGYGDGQTQGNQVPTGANYYSTITMYPIFTVITTSPLMVGNWTPNFNQSNWSAPQTGACRLSLNMDSETFWSPILNIEACVGITTPIYQVYILAVLVDIICGILIARKYKSKESFVVGAVIGNTICAISGLIAWIVWVVVIIPLALLFMYKGGK